MNSSISSSRKLPRGFLWALLLIAAFEAAVALIPPYVAEKVPYEMSMLRWKNRVASTGGNNDVMILGDCFTWAGVKPSVLERELDTSSVNMATNLAQTYLSSYLFLERYLSAPGEPPEFVLIGLSPWSLTYAPALDRDYYDRFLFPVVGARVDALRELPIRTAAGAVVRALSPPSIRMQYFLRQHNWPVKIVRADRRGYAELMSLFERGGGWFDESWDPGKRPVEEVTEVSEDVAAFRLSPLNSHYLERMLDLCESRNIPVVLCSLAVRGDRKRIWERYGVEGKMEEYISRLSSAHPCVKEFLNMTDAVPDKSYYADDYHLNERGATKYTKALCKEILSLFARTQEPAVSDGEGV